MPPSARVERAVVRPVTAEDDVEAVARVVALAFEAGGRDNVYARMLPGVDDPNERVRLLTWFFARRIELNRLAGGVVWGCFDADSGEVLGTLSLAPLAAQTPPLWALVRAGLLMAPFVLGLSTLLHILKVGDDFSAVSKRTNGHVDAEMMMVATSPTAQGEGVGTKLVSGALAAFFATSTTTTTTLRVGLATQKRRTAEWYASAFGFKETGRHVFFADAPEPLESWTMVLERGSGS